MSNQSLDESRAFWSECLVSYHFVDLERLCESLSKVLPATAPQITGKAIQDLMLLHIEAAQMSGWHRVICDKHFVVKQQKIRKLYHMKEMKPTLFDLIVFDWLVCLVKTSYGQLILA